MVIKGGKLYTFDLYIQLDRSSLLLLQINVYIYILCYLYGVCRVLVKPASAVNINVLNNHLII